MAQRLPIAGWYPDPEIDGNDRWWDGASWTDTRRMSSDAPAVVAVAPAAPASTGPQGSPGPGLYIPGETVLQPAPALVVAPVGRNNMAVIGFFLSLSGLMLPFVVNSIAGGIVSIIGLRRSKDLPGTGVFSNGRTISITGILVGFIWGGICLLGVVAFILFEVWIITLTNNVQFQDSPVI